MPQGSGSKAAILVIANPRFRKGTTMEHGEIFPVGPNHSANPEAVEQLLSRLLLSFVERRVSPQTIADIVRAQIIENNIAPQNLEPATCSGIIEAIANVRSLKSSLDILAFLSKRIDFPVFLSYSATLAALLEVLGQAPRLHTTTLPQQMRFFVNLTQSLSVHLLQHIHSRTMPPADRSRVLTYLQNIPKETRVWLTNNAAGLANLRDALVSEQLGIPETVRPHAPLLADPGDVLINILDTPDHTLAKKSASHYRCIPKDKFNSWRLENIETLRDILDDDRHSSIAKRFATEWFFNGILRDTLDDENLVTPLQKAFRDVILERNNDMDRLKGVLIALQRDLNIAATELGIPNSSHPKFTQLMQRGEKILFPNLIGIATEFPQLFARQFAWWAIQMPVTPPDARLFSRTGWRWLRAIATQVWEDELRRPPGWILSEASRFAVPLFRMAPSVWLHEFAPLLLERLLLETNRPAFRVSEQHQNYVEFLIRTLRSKSPLLRGKTEMLILLRFIERANPQEENQLRLLETRYRMLANSRSRGRTPEEDFWINVYRAEKGCEAFGYNAIAAVINLLQQQLLLVANRSKRS